MGQFNPYLWSVYANGVGKETIERFRRLLMGNDSGYASFIAGLMKAYCPDDDWIDETQYFIQVKTAETEIVLDKSGTTEEIMSGYYFDYLEKYKTPVKAQWCLSQELGGLSTLLALRYPDRFIPYYYPACFIVLQRIAEYFGIELPKLPSKGQKEKRVVYYAEISDVMNAFRVENDLTSEELWALLYDYGPKLVGGLDWVVPVEDLKEPHDVFVFGVNEVPRWSRPKPGTVFLWQGNPDMQPGDIAVLYNWAPASQFVSIWRAVSVGFNDPIFRHHRVVCYSAVGPIPPVTYKELQNDELFGTSSLVRAKMTFMDGASLSNKLYMHLLEMSRAKGKMLPSIPEVPVYSEIEIPKLVIEKDVEKYLMKDQLLPRLGWEKSDYSTQVPVRIGRGVTKYPDFVINYDGIRKKAEIVLEAKLTIPSNKQAQIDKGQARSYAKLLDARVIVLVSKEGIWIGEKYDDFDALKSYSWGELENTDVFREVYQVIGKGKKGNKR